MKICEENPNLVKIEQKYWAVHVKTYIHCCQWQSYHKHCWRHTTQQYKRNRVLQFHGKVFTIDHIFHRDMYVNSAKENTPLCVCVHGNNRYVTTPKCDICTLLILLEPEFNSKNNSQCIIEVTVWFLIFWCLEHAFKNRYVFVCSCWHSYFHITV